MKRKGMLKKEDKNIIVLDEGLNKKDIIGPEAVRCCIIWLIPYIG
jgi:hypothetical protein